MCLCDFCVCAPQEQAASCMQHSPSSNCFFYQHLEARTPSVGRDGTDGTFVCTAEAAAVGGGVQKINRGAVSFPSSKRASSRGAEPTEGWWGARGRGRLRQTPRVRLCTGCFFSRSTWLPGCGSDRTSKRRCLHFYFYESLDWCSNTCSRCGGDAARRTSTPRCRERLTSASAGSQDRSCLYCTRRLRRRASESQARRARGAAAVFTRRAEGVAWGLAARA